MLTGYHPRVGRLLSLMVDPTVVLSFSRPGYLLHRLSFVPSDLEVDLEGRTALITGANSGIGFATALELARRRAEVFLLVRDKARGDAARNAILKQVEAASVHVEVLDVAERTSIRAFLQAFNRPRVDILIHNAGVLPDTWETTHDGLERVFATHLLGPHLLTKGLEPHLRSASDARVIFVSSGGMYPSRLEVSRLTSPPLPYDGVKAYSATKRGQVVLARLWAEALEDSRVLCFSMHPGWADTPAVRASLPRFYKLTRDILRSPEEGADTVVWLAVCQRLQGQSGKLYFDRVERSPYLIPGTRESAADRSALWNLLERYAEER